MLTIIRWCVRLVTNFNLKCNEEDMNRFSEGQKRGKSPAESFLIGQIDLLPWSCARKLVTFTGVICINELLELHTVGIWVEPRVFKHIFVPLRMSICFFYLPKKKKER